MAESQTAVTAWTLSGHDGTRCVDELAGHGGGTGVEESASGHGVVDVRGGHCCVGGSVTGDTDGSRSDVAGKLGDVQLCRTGCHSLCSMEAAC